MHRAAATLIGTHDFISFQSSGSVRETTERTIYDLTIQRLAPPDSAVIYFEIEANGYLVQHGPQHRRHADRSRAG